MSENDEYWESRRGQLTSKIGKWVAGLDVNVRGESLLDDILNKRSFIQLHVLNLTGKRIDQRTAAWIENNFMGSSYPDARLWCNQIGALAGTYDSGPVAAMMAGVLSADSRAYGGSYATWLGMRFLQSTQKKIEAGKSVDEIIAQAPIKHGIPAIIGFVRPINKKDERIEPYEKITRELGFELGPYRGLAHKLSAQMEQQFNTGMNFGGFSSAFLLDQGFTPEEGYLIRSFCVISGVGACYTEYKDAVSQSFLPLHCADVLYEGRPARPVLKA